MTIPESSAETKASLLAAILLWGLEIIRGFGCSWPNTATEAIARVNAGRSQAYEILGRLKELSGTLYGQSGRPEAEPAPAAAMAVCQAVRDYLLTHPGAARAGDARSRYGDAFRRFILDLGGPGGIGHALPREQFADAVGVPVGTLDGWLREPPPAIAGEDPPPPDVPTVRQTQIALILSEWPKWHGGFSDFCTSLRLQHRFPFGPTFVGSVLHEFGLRPRTPRRQGEAPWSSGTYRALFPGFQWIGDGTTLAIWINDQLHVFNAEGIVDPASGALVAFDVSATESEQAVIDAYGNAVVTAGEPPLALTLDNKPSNLTETVQKAIAPTELLASTPARPESKAPIEGNFGLFRQTAPPLAVEGDTRRQLAGSILQLVLTTYAWARNGKPRKRLGDRSPRDVYRDDRPTPEQIQEGKEYILELRRRQERIRRTREARLDPAILALLAAGLPELDIADTDGRIASSLAGYSRDAIVYGLAAFAAKRDLDAVPADAEPHRYLGGIIRNRHIHLELEYTSRHLLEQRLRLADLALEPLVQKADRIRETRPAIDVPREFIDQALQAELLIDFRFWTRAAAVSLAGMAPPSAWSLYADLARRITASYQTDRFRRADLIDAIAGAVTATA